MKTNYLKLLSCLVTAFLFLPSCSDDDGTDFEGKDNSLVSFKLTSSGITYDASFTENEILLTIPENVSLKNAEVAYRLSEGATIVPAPEDITEWDEEHEFTVTSYNGKQREYTYTVNREKVTSAGNVVLNTQADVDAFKETGITTIEGNVVIAKEHSEADPVVSLAGLANLESITYNLIIYPGYAGESLAGLEKLEQVGGIQIGTSATLKEIALPALKSVRLDLEIESDAAEVIRFPELTTIAGSLVCETTGLTMLDMSKLESVEEFSMLTEQLEEINFPALEKTAGFSVQLTSVSSLNFSSLVTIGGNFTFIATGLQTLSFPALETLEGTLLINSRSTSLEVVHFPVLTQVNGSISMSGLRAIREILFEKLEDCRGTITIVGQSSLFKRVSFPMLQAIEQLTVSSYIQTDMEEVSFPALRTVTSTLELELLGIGKLNGFASLESVNRLVINDLSLMEEMNFPSLRVIKNQLSMANSMGQNSLLKNIDGFSSLQEVARISMSRFAVLESFYGLRNAVHAIQSLGVSGCAYNPTLADLKEGKFTINDVEE